jgi:hypothetical protein
MTAQCREADDLDLIMRDGLRDATAARADSARVWSRLCIRIASATPAPHHRPAAIRAPGRFAPPEWTLNQHLMSLARVVC